jgi:hypothetical protein
MRDGNAEIYLRSLDVEGRPSGPERRLTDTPDASYEASVERLGDALIIAWYEQTASGEQTAMLGEWDRDGAPKWMHPVAPASRNPVVRTDGRSIFCAWIQGEPGGGEAVWAGWWSPDGQEHRPRARLGPASKNTWNLNASLDRSGTAWVAFDAVASTRSNELFLAQVDAAGGARVERLTRDDGHPSKYPDVAIDGESRTALAWYDERDGTEEVYLLVTDRAGLTGEIDGRARRVTTTPGHSIGAYLAWNAGRVGLAWSDKDALQHEVYFQSFDASGMAMGATRRLTRNDTWSLVPAIRPWRDGFALAWNEYAPATGRIHEGSSEIGFTLVK